MSQPTLGAKLPEFAVENGVARIVDDGDFFVLEDDNKSAPYRAIAIYSGTTRVYGAPLHSGVASQTTPYDEFERGELQGAGTREQVQALRIPLAAGTYRWYVWGGIRYLGWGDNIGRDKVEWGNYDLSNPSRVATGTLTVSDTTPPPPPPPPPADDPYPWLPHLGNARDDLELAVAAFYMKRGQSVDSQRVLFRQRFGMMQQLGQCTSEERARAHAVLAPIFGWPT